ncbi:MAG: CBS domain-containing protein [Planctomycetota bacterium]
MNWQDLVARDLMHTELVTVATNTPLSEVERTLAEHRISGVPVTDVQGHLKGVVSLRDIVEFRAQEDGAPVHRRVEASAEGDDDPEPATYLTREEPEATAADLMTGTVFAVDADAPLREVAREMVRRRIHRVLVQDGGHHIGLISAFDVLAKVVDA